MSVVLEVDDTAEVVPAHKLCAALARLDPRHRCHEELTDLSRQAHPGYDRCDAGTDHGPQRCGRQDAAMAAMHLRHLARNATGGEKHQAGAEGAEACEPLTGA